MTRNTLLDKPTSSILNRELGILEFNSRVLAQAEDPNVPLLERLKFVCIVSSNLDEFFEVRMAGIKEQLKNNPEKILLDGIAVSDSFKNIAQKTHELVTKKYSILIEQIIPQLSAKNIEIDINPHWHDKQKKWAKQYFKRELFPLLTPIALDPAHPFPKVINKSLNFLVTLHGRDNFGRKAHLAVVQAPRVLPRLIKMPKYLSGNKDCFVLLTSFMQAFVSELFPGIETTGCYQFRVTRNSDLFVSEDEMTDLRLALEGELPTRHLGDAVKLEIAAETPNELIELIRDKCHLTDEDCYRVSGPVNLVRLSKIPELLNRPELKFKQKTPRFAYDSKQYSDLFKLIRQKDILLHLPYESFEPVLMLLRQAAEDPQVLAIKQTVYRTGDESEVMDALMKAAKNGKEVTVVLELLARFEEQTNINWATKLEEVGAHVVYGVVGHKCHAKMLLIIRREPINGIKGKTKLASYVHLSTGNYHPKTAKLYTDFGLFTAETKICNDVHLVFQQLTGTVQRINLARLWQSPFTLHGKIIDHIRQEAKNAKAGKKGHIIAKMNALLEHTVIQELYKASAAGVKIELIIRGVCTLKPNIKGLSENIQVRSIIGRFLEHHRIFYFYAGGEEKTFLSSADWMDRNLHHRVEIAFPILDPQIKARVIEEGLKNPLKDNYGAWIMNSLGQYKKVIGGCNQINSQVMLWEKN